MALATSICAASCARQKQPVLLIHPKPLGDGEKVLRDLYRSSWIPPATDQDFLRVGIIPSEKIIRFQALSRMRIRALSEHESWEVASPQGVIWRASAGKMIRPPIITYFATVKTRLVRFQEKIPSAPLAIWKKRGYESVRWVGPPRMDDQKKQALLERWFVSLTPPTGKKAAASVCKRVRRVWKSSCIVIARMELPQMGTGILEAENSNFSKKFHGILELVSPRSPIQVLDVLPEERTGEKIPEDFGPKLYIVPGFRNDLALVQSTSLGNYLEGVVPSEIFPRAPIEALRSQAIIARTYALRYLGMKKLPKPFSICGSTKCQVYRGVKHKKPLPSKAVQDTANIVVWEKPGHLAETFYHAICGGHTEPRAVVFGRPNRFYLQGTLDEFLPGTVSPLYRESFVQEYLNKPPSAYCGIATLTKKDRWRWSAQLDQEKLAKILKELRLTPPLTDVKILRRGISGRVLSMTFETALGSKIISGEYRIRMLLGGLLSSLFVLEKEQYENAIQTLTIQGGGYGHGVGLCQMGSIGRAEKGQTFQEILQAYYPGTILAPLNAAMVR